MIETLHIILPGLFYSAGEGVEESPQYPSLVRLLSKATVVPNRPVTFEGVLKSHFSGLPCREIPAGSLTALAYDLTEDQVNWFRVDPIYLKSDAHDIYCLGNHVLDISEYETEGLVQSLNEWLEPQGMHLFPVKNKTWVMSHSSSANISTNALADVEGKSIKHMLPSGPEAKFWHQWLTECQMILHNHPINKARIEQRLLPINSLWLWGNGRVPEKIQSFFDCVFSQNKIMQGLSKAADIPCYDDIDDFAGMFDHMTKQQRVTGAVIDSRLQRANNLLDANLRQSLLGYYEQHWFKPLEEALMDGTIKSITIDACHGKRYLISKRHFKYFWRKNQDVVSFVV